MHGVHQAQINLADGGMGLERGEDKKGGLVHLICTFFTLMFMADHELVFVLRDE